MKGRWLIVSLRVTDLSEPEITAVKDTLAGLVGHGVDVSWQDNEVDTQTLEVRTLGKGEHKPKP